MAFGLRLGREGLVVRVARLRECAEAVARSVDES